MYNCIAWAADDKSQNWWPHPWDDKDYYWPDGVARTNDMVAFEAGYATLGFSKCDGPEQEDGFTKIAVFAKGGEPKHAARLVRDGVWTSKLGELDDIEHSLNALGGSDYGEPVLFMKKPK